MNIRRLYTIILLLLPLVGFAQNKVTGRVLDANTRQPLDFVNVSATLQNETTPVAGNTTDENGDFVLSLKDGTYTIRISFVGYIDVTRTITLQDGKDVSVNKIYLQEDTQTLSEVEVVGQGSTMRFELDKKVFSVDQNIASAGGSVTDVLENIPSVDVDQEGNISLRNSEDVEIWINGKPTGLTSDTRAQVLQQLPAESIKEIELITNPSAKFSPEGTAGIINLVMKKDRQAGYYGSVNLDVDYALSKPWTTPPGGKLGFNINFSKGIVDAYFNVGYHYRNSNGSTYTDRYNYYDNDTTRMLTSGQSHHSGGGMFLRGGVDIRVTDRSTIGVSGFGIVETKNDPTNGFFSNRTNNPTHYTLYNITSFVAPQDAGNQEDTLRSYDRNEQGSANHPGYNAMLSWNFDISKAHKLQTSAQFFNFGFNNDNYYIQTENGVTTTQEQISDNTDRFLQLKADYEWHPTKDSRLEAGWQTDLAWRQTQASAYNGENQEDTLWSYYNDFHNNEQTHALYITYGNRFWDKLSLQVGLRGEYFMRHIQTEYYYDNALCTNTQDTAYFQLFPSAYISYDFGNGHELQLNYTRRVDRPRGHMINPRMDFSDSTNIQFGNPALLPSYSSSLELNYLKTWDRHTLSAGLFWRAREGVIQNVKFLDGETMKNTFINLSSRQELGVEVVAKNRLFGELLQLTTSVNFYYNYLKANSYHSTLYGTPVDIELHSRQIFAGSVRVNASFMFTKTFSGQISAHYRSPRVTAQGSSSHSYSIDLGLRKTFLDKKLALALNVRDILDSRARRNTSYSDDFWQYQENRWHSRTISLSFTYSFGNMKKNSPMDGAHKSDESNIDSRYTDTSSED